jgi:L-2-hydroxycarboxylate dehydrogenase (NAD+)
MILSHPVEGMDRNMVTVAAAEETALITDVLAALRVAPADAALQAELLTEADLRGFASHGVQRLPTIVERIENGVSDGRARPRFDWLSDAVLAVDGARGLGPVVAMSTITALAERARLTGIALGLVSNCNHLGMLAFYAERVAESGHMLIALTTSEALVHPYGGRRALIGTNPIAIGIPSTPHPLVLDMATGTVSMGKIVEHAKRSEPIPAGWALDAAGKPTTDPVAATGGAIAPFGGAKGYGLGLAFELLVASLTRSALGTNVVGTLDSDSVCNKGDLFIYIDPSAVGLADVTERLEPYLTEVRQSGGVDDPVRLPGERSRRVRRERLAGGIPIAAEVWLAVTQIRERLVPGRVHSG